MSPRGRKVTPKAADQAERDAELAAELELPAQPELPEEAPAEEVEQLERPAVPTSADQWPGPPVELTSELVDAMRSRHRAEWVHYFTDAEIAAFEAAEARGELPQVLTLVAPVPTSELRYRVLRQLGAWAAGTEISVGELIGGADRAAELAARGVLAPVEEA